MRYFSVALISTLAIVSYASAQDKKANPAVEQAKSKIRAAGGSVLELAQNDDRLEVAFHLSDKKVTDATLKSLAGLTKVAALNLRGTDVTSAGLAQLKGLKGLTHLHLEKTKVNDEGLKHLKELPDLVYLNLYGTGITNAGLANLSSLKKLKRLYVWETKVTRPAGLAFAKQMKGLTVIGLPEPPKPPEAKKPVTPKADPKKPAAKKPAVKKPAAKKPAAKKAPAKKPAAKKETPKKPAKKK